MASKKQKEFKPNELPTRVTRTIYVGYGIGKYNAGRIVVQDCESDSTDFATVRLIAKDSPFKLPKGEIDIKGKMLTVLEAKKKEVLAANHARLAEVQSQIDN